MKITSLGVDTAKTLDIFGNVICAARKNTEVKTTAIKVENGGSRPNSSAEETEEKLGKSKQNNDAVAPAALIPGDTPGHVTIHSSASDTEEETTTQKVMPTATSLSPLALWSIEFWYSELERVLGALETALSGLCFVIVTEAGGDTEIEASALW